MPFDTTDYRQFLTRALERRGLQQQDLAREVGRTGGWLSLVLSGQRNLDPALVDDLVRALRLSDEEATYFAALVDLESRSPRARRTAWATVQATQRHHATAAFHEDVARAYAHWYIRAVAELAACEGFRPEPRWIARTLEPPITVDQAEEALRALLRLGMLVPDDAGGLRPGQELTWSPSDLPEGEISRAGTEAHLGSLELARHALETLWQNERHVSGITLALTESQYAVMKARLAELEREMVVLAEQTRGDEPLNRVYQLGVFLVPVSGYTDTEGDG